MTTTVLDTLAPWAKSPAMLGVAAVLALGLLYYLALPKPYPGIPYNPEARWRILGDVPSIQASPYRRRWFMEQCIRHKSPIVQLFLSPFGKPIVLVCDFREQQDVCLRRHREFDRSSLNKVVFGGVAPEHHISMKTADPRFKGNKELLRDLMTPAFLHDVSGPLIYEKVLSLVQLWTLKARLAKGRPFEAQFDIYLMAMDVILAAAFALDESRSVVRMQLEHLEAHQSSVPDVGDDKDAAVVLPQRAVPDEMDALTRLTESLSIPMRSPLPRLAHWLWRQRPSSRRSFALKEQLIETEIAASLQRLFGNGGHGEAPSLEKGGKRCAMDDMLMRERSLAAKQGRKPDYYSQTIKDELFGYLIAGHETTATTSCWGLKLLTDNPEAQNRLRTALRRALPEAAAARRQPTIDELTRTTIPLLDATMEEIFRLSPTLPLVSRQATVDTILLGYRIPKDTNVFFASNGPSYILPAFDVDESLRSDTAVKSGATRYGVWRADDVERFVPERWLKPATDGDAAAASIESLDATDPHAVTFDATNGPLGTFGHGPRGCFGRRLAYLEMRLLLALLVWNFEFEKVPEALSSYEPRESMVTHPLFCYVRLKKVGQP